MTERAEPRIQGAEAESIIVLESRNLIKELQLQFPIWILKLSWSVVISLYLPHFSTSCSPTCLQKAESLSSGCSKEKCTAKSSFLCKGLEAEDSQLQLVLIALLMEGTEFTSDHGNSHLSFLLWEVLSYLCLFL